MSRHPANGDARQPLKLRLFNPRSLGDADLARSFIARQTTFRAILDDVTAEATESQPQHYLIIGQRGMGKTMLLCRLAVELRRAPHRTRFVPLSFPEEQHVEVDRLSKFWLNCLDALADALETEGTDSRLVEEIDTVVQGIDRIPSGEAEAEVAAREAFTDAWHRLSRRPVLLIDNFNLLLNRLKEHDYQLRGYFTAPGAPILVAACTDLAERLQDYGAAFYEGFKHHWLRPLSLEEMREVVERLGRASGRDDLVNRLPRELPRIAALRDLTGGNPRTAVLLFDLFADGFSEDATEDLDQLLDVVTALYQSRLEQLAEQAQVVVGALARTWRPMTSAEICDVAGLEHNKVSSQLHRLKDLSFVEETAVFPSKRTGYQIAERFFNVWYLMRFATRRQRSQLGCLTHFLQVFHTPEGLTASARQLLGRSSLSHREIPYALALAESVASESTLSHALARKAQLELVEQMNGVRDRIAEILEPGDIDQRIYEFAELKEKLRKAVPPDAAVTGEEFARLVLASPALLPGGSDGKLDRNALAESKLTPQRITETTTELRRETEKLSQRFGKEAVEWLQERLQKGLITSWTDAEEISLTILDAPDDEWIPMIADFMRAVAKQRLQDEAFARVHRCLEPKVDDSAQRWLNWGYKLHLDYGHYAEAEQAYRRAIALNPKYALPWNNLGVLLQDHLGRYAEAEQAYRQAIALDPKGAYPWNNLGNLLQDHLGRYAEAEQAYRQAIALDPKYAHPWNGLGNLLADYLGQFNDARNAYQNVIELDPDNDIARLNLVFLLRDFLGDRPAAKGVLADLRQPDQGKDTRALSEVLFGAYDENWGLATEALRKALHAANFVLPPYTRDDWFRASAVLLHLGFGEKLVAFLKEEGADIKMLPWFEAVQAHARGDRRYLLNVPVEARPVAETIFDEIQKRRERLPGAAP